MIFHLYSKEHVCMAVLYPNVKIPKNVSAGVTAYAVEQLGQIVMADLGKSQRVVKRGDELGSVESVKTVSSVVCPFDCEVKDVNVSLEKDPSPLNGKGKDGAVWLYVLRPLDEKWRDGLMDREAYMKYLKEELGYEAEEDQAD